MVDVEKEHVHKVYSKIAAHFSDTRFKPWPRIAQFLQSQPPGSLIADVGCGNGKYLGVNSEVFVLGSDICPELVAIGRSRGHEVLTCDCLNLPYRSNQFDGVICIAVVHHLSSESRRLQSLTEMARVLRPGGQMLVYVWAMEQERKKFDEQDVMVPWHMQSKYRAGEKGSCEKGVDPTVAQPKVKKRERKKQKKKDVFSVGEDVQKVTLEGTCSHEEPSCTVTCSMEAETCGGQAQKCSCSPMRKQELTQPTHTRTRTHVSTEDQELVRQGYTTYQRYYHVFKAGELVGLFKKVPQLQIKEDFYDHENWCVLAEKLVV